MLTNRYTTTVTIYNNEYEAVEITSTPIALLKSKKLADPYVMGYVTPEKFPRCFNINVAQYSSNHMAVSFVDDITQQNNIGWGYCDLGNYESAEASNLYAITENNTLYDSRSNTAQSIPRLLNKIKMANAVTNANGMSVLIRGIIMPVADEPADDAIIFNNTDNRLVSATVYVNNDDYFQLMQTRDTPNPTKIQFSVNFGGDARTFEFNDNDFNEHNIAKLYDSNLQYVIYIAVIGFSFQTITRLGYGSNTYAQTRVQPFYRIPLDANNTANINTDICAMFIPGAFRPSDKRFKLMWDDSTIQLYEDSFSARGYLAGYHIGNYPYTIDSEELATIPGMTYNKQGIIYGKYILDSAGYSSPNYSIYRIYCQNTLADGWAAYNLYHKCVLQGVSYTNADYFLYNGKFQVSLFDANDTPTGVRAKTDSTDPEMMEDLRPWQALGADITADQFSPESIPSYIPIGENENVGDKITRPAIISAGGTNGFITQYTLRKSQVQELGQILWTSVFDQDYWKNFMFSLALDTGSFSLSSLLSFFLSLKVYPFSLANIRSHASWGTDMYFGTGIKPLEFNTTLSVINNYVDYISGGYAIVWSKNFFGDFRDYVNTEITLYVPYCGTVQLNPGDVIGNKISVQYAVDFASGGCIAYVDLETGDGAGYPIAAIPGQIGADIPLTATAAGDVAARFIGDAMGVGHLVGGEVAGVAAGAAQAMAGGEPSGGSGNVLSGAIGAIAGPMAAMGADIAPGLGGMALNMLTRGAVSAPMLGGARGFASFGAPQTPFIQIRRGIYPEDPYLPTHAGQPAASGVLIAALTGFIQGTVKMDGMQGVTQEEQAAIIAAISAGIFV